MNKCMKYFATLIIGFIALSEVATAQNLSTKIENAFEAFERDPNMEYGIASITVLNGNTGEVVYAKNEGTGLATASTMKAITTATAYSVLGGNYQYETSLRYSGTIDGAGVLNGDVIIQGTGDPSLGSENFDETKPETILAQWVNAIKEAGIKKIKGSIIGDDILFNGHMAPSGWTWVDMGQYYGSGVSSLNWRENKFKIILSGNGKVGDEARLQRTIPAKPYLKIINEVTIGKSGTGDRVYAFSAPYSSFIILRGTYAADLNKQIEISVPDGAHDAAWSLQSALERQGVSIEKPATTAFLMKSDGETIPLETTLLDRYFSPTVSQICYWFMKRSINLYGEALLKTAALQEGSEPETSEATDWEKEYWSERIGEEEGALKIKDGSGLSPESRVTTMAMAKILLYAKKQNWFGSYYENMPTYNKMKMKSGTIGGVLGYTGYHTASDGTPLVFSFLINNHAGRSHPMRLKMFKMLDALK